MIVRKKKDTKPKPTKRKKKPGRKKKRGRKKSKVVKKVIVQEKEKHKIIVTSHNKQSEYIGWYPTAAKANQAFYKILEECKNIKFPVMYVNTNHQIKPAKFELVLLRERKENESTVSLIRNEFGTYVEHETTNDKWIVVDKAEYLKEETFWVYGYHPNVQRKDYFFIFDNLVKKYASNKETFLSIKVYKNKLFLESTFHQDLITCKNRDDAIRLYNMIQKDCEEQKLKYVLFNGNWGIKHAHCREMIDKIHALTNWSELKIRRSNTRP